MVFQSCIWKGRGGHEGGLAGNTDSESEWILNYFEHREGERKRHRGEKLICPARETGSAGHSEVSAGHLTLFPLNLCGLLVLSKQQNYPRSIPIKCHVLLNLLSCKEPSFMQLYPNIQPIRTVNRYSETANTKLHFFETVELNV